MKTDVPKRCTNYTSKARRVNTCDNSQHQNFYTLFHYEVYACKSKLGYPRQNFKFITGIPQNGKIAQ